MDMFCKCNIQTLDIVHFYQPKKIRVEYFLKRLCLPKITLFFFSQRLYPFIIVIRHCANS